LAARPCATSSGLRATLLPVVHGCVGSVCVCVCVCVCCAWWGAGAAGRWWWRQPMLVGVALATHVEACRERAGGTTNVHPSASSQWRPPDQSCVPTPPVGCAQPHARTCIITMASTSLRVSDSWKLMLALGCMPNTSGTCVRVCTCVFGQWEGAHMSACPVLVAPRWKHQPRRPRTNN